MTEEATTEEVVTYAGRRTLTTGKIGYSYQDANGEVRYYQSPMVDGQQVGNLITITRPADSPDSYYSRGQYAPRLTGFDETVEADLLERWQAADRAAYQVKADADAAKRAAKQAGGVESHIEALIAATRNLPGSQRAAFARYVEDRIRGW